MDKIFLKLPLDQTVDSHGMAGVVGLLMTLLRHLGHRCKPHADLVARTQEKIEGASSFYAIYLHLFSTQVLQQNRLLRFSSI